MDDSEDPLGKISRQLSELAAVSNSSAASTGHSPSTVSPAGGQWTQFSGISPQAGHPSFRNLYTWNPLDLPDFRPLSGPVRSNSETSSNQYPSGTTSNDNCDFINAGHLDWQRENPSPQRFQVTGDLAGSLVVSRNKVSTSRSDQQNYSLLGHGSFQSPEEIFHTDRNTNTQVYRQLSQPSPPSPFANSDRLTRLSAPSASSINVSGSVMPENILGDERMNMPPGVLQDGTSHGIPVENVPHAHLLQTPPVFDPSTPPPVFPLQRHQRENQPSSPISSNATHDDVVDYLRMQNKAKVNLDLGINIDRGNRQQYADLDNNIASNEGRNIYEAAMKQWHSFDSSNLTNLNSPVSPTQSKKQESRTEPTATDSSKPTYSDIAKTPKTGQSLGAKGEQPNNDIKNMSQKPAKKDLKPLRPLVKRTASGSKFWPKGSLGGDADQPKMSPTSRYGLDNFDEHVLGSGSHSNSSENLSVQAKGRRGSGSSAGSSVSALDDITTQAAAGRTTTVESDVHNNDSSENKSYANATKLPVSSKSQSASGQSPLNESLFFDPRRIFQSKNTNKSRAQSQGNNTGKSKVGTHAGLDGFGTSPNSTDTVLNNGKPTASSSTSKLSSSARQHDYINNDLRDASKLTNQTAAESGQGIGNKAEEVQKHRESRAGRRSTGRTNGLHRRDRRKSPDNDVVMGDEGNEDEAHHQQRPGFLPDHFDTEKLEEWCCMAWEKMSHWGNLFITTLLNLLIYMLGCVLYLASFAVHLLVLSMGKFWTLVKEKLFQRYFGSKEEASWNSRDYLRRRVGLEENICLPSTGDEAMKRLLSCKGKDPYSILGLRADSSDEDIKKYYRKQAVLVHPDKNQEPGAEEAFKILGHAFEMIGEPAKRKQYDSHTQEANEADAMREFAEMLSKLQTKIQEAANIMRCDNCGDKHRRVPVDRPFYSARFCQECNICHSAKEGDVWAESTMLGFYWHYYALMEGHVFDITEWMKCHRDYFKHMKANAHSVMYKIATDGNRRSKHHQSGEANLEDIINRLFNKSSHASGDGQGPAWGSHPGANSNWGQGTGSAATAAASAKKSRRKKKRHQ